MRALILAISAILSFTNAAHASQWTKVLACESGVGTLVVDRDSTNFQNIQIVIVGTQAAQSISYGMTGGAEWPNLHLYDSGNKLVASDLTMTANYNPFLPSSVFIDDEGGDMVILKYVMANSDVYTNPRPQGEYRFYNCTR